MTAFASTTDLNAFVGFTVDTNQGNAVLSIASEAIRAYTGRQFDVVTGDVYLDQRGDTSILLPELPVTNVSAVQVLAPDGTWITLGTDPVNPDYIWDAHTGVVTIRQVGQPISPVPTVQITYDHGYVTVPEVIKQVCVTIAARLLANPHNVLSQATGQVSVRFQRETDLTSTEQRMLARYTTVGVS